MNQTFDVIQVGDVATPLFFKVDQHVIQLYAEASGDFNPLHVDPEFAKSSKFGNTIAHGMMTLAFISQAMMSQNSYGWLNGGILDVSFISPIFPGDEIQVRAGVREKRTDSRTVIYDVSVVKGTGEMVVKGTCVIAFPEDGRGKRVH